MLRAVLLVLGAALTAGAGFMAVFGHMPAAWHLGVPGLVLLAGMLTLNYLRYKPLEPLAPGPGWVETPERFVDPETGKDVTVYYQPSSGERRYVAR